MPASTTTATIKHVNLYSQPKDTGSGSSALKDVSRHSPVISLPPLDYLQQHRRGSITDPSLHAASANSSAGPRHIDGPRPAANYTFGDGGGSTHNSESSSKQMRKILRSPSAEWEPAKGIAPLQTSHPLNGGTKTTDHMNVDSSHEKQSPRVNTRQADDSDHSSRRQSIANSSDSQMPHGTKRKTSTYREANGSDDTDSQLVGPGVPSPMNIDSEGRAQKRRGSTIEMSRIAQLSIYDQRRHSVHSGSIASATGPGISGGNGHWWLNERRDSLPPSFPNGTTSGYPSALSGDQPHGRPAAPSTPGSMATFAWSPAQHPDGSQDPNIQHHPRPFETQPMQMTMMPPMTFPSDRRMSVPEGSTSTIGPTRNIRSRSRPPSRQLRENSQTVTTAVGPAPPAEEPSSAPSPSPGLKPPKEPGSTPYSRSPELRVSHKLAERKRRKEMKDLFDELRDQLPADRGMKASKWEILSKAIDFVTNLKQSHQDMVREIEMLRHELESMRQGIPSFGPGAPPHAMVYGQGAPVPGPYPPPPPPPGAISHPPPHPHQQPPHPPQPRPPSSENPYPAAPTTLPSAPTGAPPAPTTNGVASIPTNKSEVQSM